MKKYVSGLVAVAAVLGSVACGDDGDNVTGVLADVKKRGTLRVATDPAYPPQSSRDDSGVWTGFDVDTARGIAEELDVTAEFVTPEFATVVEGGWDQAWDISVGSVAITTERQGFLKFSDPYYYVPAYYAVKSGSGITTIADLNGKTICVASGTTYESFVSGSLSIPQENIYVSPPTGVTLIAVSTDSECGPIVNGTDTADPPRVADAVLTANTTLKAIVDGGIALTQLSDAVFAEADACAFDRDQRTDNDTLVAAVNKALQSLRNSGKLTASSETNFGFDATNAPR